MTPQNIHAILSAESVRTGLPQFYKNDVVVHDLNQLIESPTEDFIWVLRTCGSHLVDLTIPRKFGSAYNLVTAIGSSFDGHVWYHFKDGILTEITFEEAKKLATMATPKKENVPTVREWDWC